MSRTLPRANALQHLSTMLCDVCTGTELYATSFGVGAHAVALLVTARTMRASDTIFGQDKENTIYLNGRETTPSANEVRTVYLNSSIGRSFALIHMNPSLCWYGSAFALFMLLSHRKHKNQQLQWHHSLPRAFQPQAASYIEVHIQLTENYHL